MNYVPVFTLCQTSGRMLMDNIEKMCSGNILESIQGIKRTNRIVMPVNIDGDALRLSFHNADTLSNGCLDMVTVALSDANGKINPDTCVLVTFNREPKLYLSQSERKASDEIPFIVKAGDWIAVSVYSEEPAVCWNMIDPYIHQSHEGNYCAVNFEDEDKVSMTTGKTDIQLGGKMQYFCQMEVRTGSKPKVVACIGDSITQQGYWFSVLQQRLYEQQPGKIILLNAGIGGNRLLKGSPKTMETMFGAAAIDRMEQDVFAVHGLSQVVVALGINDLIHAENIDEAPIPSSEEFAAGLKKVVQRAKTARIGTIVFTIYPATLDTDKEKAVRREMFYHAYNDAIRNAGFDHVLETEEFLRAPDHQGYRDDSLCQADKLHLSSKGGKILAESIDLNWFI